jgi:uncharacterized protein (DUF302 family)
MNAQAVEHTFVIAERFDKALKTIRGAIADKQLEIAGELDVAELVNGRPSKSGPRSLILLVDCPVLMFEALALDRAAAVFFPLHVLITAAGSQTLASLTNPAGLFDARLPVGAADPMDRLQIRVVQALDSASRRVRCESLPTGR